MREFLLCSKPQILSGQIQYAATKFLTLQRHFLPRACAIHAIEGDGIDHPKQAREKKRKKAKIGAYRESIRSMVSECLTRQPVTSLHTTY